MISLDPIKEFHLVLYIPLANTKLRLTSVGFQPGSYYIKNDSYLKWDSYKFKQGFAAFTESGKLYQINLVLEDSYSSCLSIYNTMRSKMISLFGLDNEYDTKKKSDPRNVSWDGKKIYIWLTFNPNPHFDVNEGIASVGLMIGDIELNRANSRSTPKDTENGIPIR